MKQEFIEDNIIILSKQTLDVMFKHNDPSDLIGLYCFYYYTAKWQKTNIIKCSTSYVMKGLKWSKDRVIKNKKILKEIKLISDITRKNKKGQITGWYIKINYIWKKETIQNQRVAQPEGGLDHPVAEPPTNALNDSSLNALNVGNKTAGEPAGSDNLNKTIELFKEVNPTYERLFSNKTQRGALERLVKKFGLEEIEKIINILPQLNREQYAPTITTPYQLEEKLGQIKAFIQKKNNKPSSFGEAYNPNK